MNMNSFEEMMGLKVGGNTNSVRQTRARVDSDSVSPTHDRSGRPVERTGRPGRPRIVRDDSDTSGTDRRRQSIYFSDVGQLEALEAEAKRLGRSLSWVIQQACRIALSDIQSMPGGNVSE